jgi:hypothetical protein
VSDRPEPPDNCGVCAEPVGPHDPGARYLGVTLPTGRLVVNMITCGRPLCTALGKAAALLVTQKEGAIVTADLHQSGDCDCEKAPADAD